MKKPIIYFEDGAAEAGLFRDPFWYLLLVSQIFFFSSDLKFSKVLFVKIS